MMGWSARIGGEKGWSAVFLSCPVKRMIGISQICENRVVRTRLGEPMETHGWDSGENNERGGQAGRERSNELFSNFVFCGIDNLGNKN
jgi:hypothetical protein